MQEKVYVAGVGMTAFVKPGQDAPYTVTAPQAIGQALQDAGLDFDKIQEAYAGYVYGDSTCGQRALYEVGMSGIPLVNVNNNCSTGSSALYLARKAIASGSADCVLAFGFEQMQPGALGQMWHDRPNPFDRFNAITDAVDPDLQAPLVIRYFGLAGQEHMRKWGTSLSTFAKIRAKASRHAQHNPLALFRTPVTEEEVLASAALIPGAMTRLMACPPTCGAAAAILVSETFAKRHGLDRSVSIRAQALRTDEPQTFEGASMINLVGSPLSAKTAQQVYEAAGVGPQDIDLCELHDCFAQNELLTYEALGFCAEGQAEQFVLDGDNTYGGAVVTNPSGGLLSKGHPLGATGLAQCYELTQQLRGNAGVRQVQGARLALQHNIGLGGAAVVSLFERTA
ncbi:lipid-transfer protein [Lampropedia aestuarii]|uniref:propanoyl-CoA C-acyltransferase n=1 Tax=Lampropedia aestuarii TaxID=2562762 RepID=A0A4S5BJC9_9BURK|nr:lipid-transfer protein [Lampropedia aestuarii]MDH5859208.1 lipid-transfer protein [Lampropedia aestuarii]THJ30731.1 lipid-transfer protein [Lampropedia aestuarii]